MACLAESPVSPAKCLDPSLDHLIIQRGERVRRRAAINGIPADVASELHHTVLTERDRGRSLDRLRERPPAQIIEAPSTASVATTVL